MQHPIGMTGAPIATEALMKSPADWIQPQGKAVAYRTSQGRWRPKVVIVDSDHCDPWNHDTRLGLEESVARQPFHLDGRLHGLPTGFA